jgi:hypothetical protein
MRKARQSVLRRYADSGNPVDSTAKSTGGMLKDAAVRVISKT